MDTHLFLEIIATEGQHQGVSCLSTITKGNYTWAFYQGRPGTRVGICVSVEFLSEAIASFYLRELGLEGIIPILFPAPLHVVVTPESVRANVSKRHPIDGRDLHGVILAERNSPEETWHLTFEGDFPDGVETRILEDCDGIAENEEYLREVYSKYFDVCQFQE